MARRFRVGVESMDPREHGMERISRVRVRRGLIVSAPASSLHFSRPRRICLLPTGPLPSVYERSHVDCTVSLARVGDGSQWWEAHVQELLLSAPDT